MFEIFSKHYLYNANITNMDHIKSTIKLWHSCLGHAAIDIIKTVLQSCHISFKNNYFMFCDTCVTVKAHQIPFVKSNNIYYSS